MKKIHILIVVVVAMLVSGALMIVSVQKNESVQHKNFFEYAVNLSHDKFEYAPNGAAEYGMSMEAV